MKNGKYKLVSLIGIVVAVGAIAWGIVSMANQAGSAIGSATVRQEGIRHNISVTKADQFDIQGVWEVELSKGEPALSIDCEAEEFKKIKFEQQGNQISLRQDNIHPGRTVKVFVSMPDVTKIRLEGFGSMKLTGLQLKQFDLAVQGGCSVNILKTTIDSLKLSVEGISNIKMEESTATNAEIFMQGASNARLIMGGGTLGGSIEGVGHLTYSGLVKAETIRTDGLAKVQKE